MTSIDIMEFMNEAPFADEGITSDDYMPLDVILGQSIEIKKVKPFENQNGAGVYILANDGNGDFYMCTHSIGLTKTLSKTTLLDALERGDTITATIIKRKSKDSDRLVYSFKS